MAPSWTVNEIPKYRNVVVNGTAGAPRRRSLRRRRRQTSQLTDRTAPAAPFLERQARPRLVPHVQQQHDVCSDSDHSTTNAVRYAQEWMGRNPLWALEETAQNLTSAWKIQEEKKVRTSENKTG
jgi:hypothetical protein